jgi:hypothetical protein
MGLERSRVTERNSQGSVPGWPGWCSIALTIYVAFAIYAFRIHGFGTNFPAMLRWARPGLWISLFAILFVLAGRGRSRLFGLASSLVMFILWIIPVWGM